MPLSEEQLVSELRAVRPEPDPDFAARLDERAAAGFSARRGKTAAGIKRPTPRRRRAWMPRLALAASFLAALVVSVGVLASLTTDRGSEQAAPDDATGLSSGESGSSKAAAPAERDADTAAAPSARESIDETIEPTIEPLPLPPGPGGDQLKPGQERVQERDAQMTLSTEPGEVAEVADGVVEVTERYGGIVVSSNANTSAERGRAGFDLRVPTANLQVALADLSDLASVKDRSEGSLDITAPYIGAEERFADARAAVDALLAQLADAGSAAEVAEARQQLRVARAELAAARAELAELKRRAEFSRVAVTVVGDGDADGWSLGDALDDAVSVLEDLAGAALIALAVLLPLGLLATGAWLLYTRIRRSWRDRVLDR